MEIKEQIENIEKLRNEVQDMKNERERLMGKIEASKIRVKELEAECVKKFGVEIDKLESKRDDLEKEINETYQKIEVMLKGIK